MGNGLLIGFNEFGNGSGIISIWLWLFVVLRISPKAFRRPQSEATLPYMKQLIPGISGRFDGGDPSAMTYPPFQKTNFSCCARLYADSFGFTGYIKTSAGHDLALLDFNEFTMPVNTSGASNSYSPDFAVLFSTKLSDWSSKTPGYSEEGYLKIRPRCSDSSLFVISSLVMCPLIRADIPVSGDMKTMLFEVENRPLQTRFSLSL